MPDQGRKALHSERDDIFPDLHGLDLKGRLRVAFLTDRGLRLPVFLLMGQREACTETASRRWPGVDLHGRAGGMAELFRQMEAAEIVSGFLYCGYRR